MKKLFTLLTVALLGVSMGSCSYDDDDLWKAVDDLDSRVEAMEKAMQSANTDIDALRKLVEALQGNVTVTSVVKNADGYTITFSNGETATITDGKNGIDAPAISVKKDDDGFYYWTLDGEFILVDGEKIKAQGEDGAAGQSAVAPRLRINTETKEWEMSTDGGTVWIPMGVKAEGTDGVDGDTLFESVTDGESEVTFLLSDGTTIVIPKATAPEFGFVHSADEEPLLFAFSERKILPLKVGEATAADFMNIPQGWTATLDLENASVALTAPAASGADYCEGIVSLVGVDRNGTTLLASLAVRAVDYSHSEGAFVLNEGNMTSENGSLIYITSTGRVIDRAYWRMNGTELGNVTQDLCIANGKMYIIAQNGNRDGGDGTLVVADAATLKRTAAYNDELSSLSWPTHVAVAGSTAYIRDNNGVYAFDLDSHTLTFVDGTKGALKNRMAVVGDKVFVPASKSVLVIEHGAVVRTIACDGAVSGVIRSDDGNIWVSCTASPAQIVKLNATDYAVEKHELDAEYKVGAGWGATPGISAKGDRIYFCNASSKIYCHTFGTNTTEYLTDVKDHIANWGMAYNNPGVHPVTGELYYTSIKGYGQAFLTNDIAVFDFSTATPVLMNDYQDYTHFPAGTFFTAAF